MSEVANLFLAALPDAERERVLAVASEVEHGNGDQLAAPGQPFDTVLFPIDSVTSVLTVLSDGKAVEAASECPDAIVCLDLARVTFIDSTAIHAIAVAVNRVPEGCVILHEPSRAVRRVFEIVGLDAWPNVHIV